MSGLSDIIDFKLFEGKKVLGALKKDPTRLLTGVDPASTKVWNAVKGTDDKPLVDEWGGTTKENMAAADKAGINTGPGRAMEGLAHAVAAYFAGNYAGGKLGLGNASTGANTNATNPALIESAVGTPGYGASSASGAGAGLSSANPQQWMQLGQQFGKMGNSGGQQQEIEGVDLAALAAAQAAAQREQDRIALSTKKAKRPGGDAGLSLARGVANEDPIDANGAQVAAVKELAKRVTALRKRISAAKQRKGD